MVAGLRIPPSRLPAAALVLLLHLGLLLVLNPAPTLQRAMPALQLRFIEEAPRVAPRPVPPAARSQGQPLPRPPSLGIPSPALPEPQGAGGAQPAEAQPAVPEPMRPLDLRLPARPPQAPALRPLHEQIRADGRANSPREGAQERMAAALGGAGWRVIDLGDGARKVLGPFGECYISRPSMVNEVPGHPLAGLVPDKIFGCGGIEKGSLNHERPK